MTSIATLCQSAPDAGHGYEVHADGTRLAVLLAVPATAGADVWGAGQWGFSVWCDDWEWLDLTPRLYGYEFQRGTNSPADRPPVGTATVTLNNDDETLDLWDDLSYPYFAEGAVVQIVAHNPSTGWHRAQFTGIIETATEAWASDLGTARIITVTLTETLGDLATYVEPTAAPAGEGEFVGQRLTRLLPSSWRFGSTGFGTAGPIVPTPYMQATTLTGPRLTEMYVTAETGGMDLRSGRDGRASLDPRPYTSADIPTVGANAAGFNGIIALAEDRDTIAAVSGPTTYELLPMASCDVYRDDNASVGQLIYTRIGGTPQAIDNGTRTGSRGLERSDLLATTDEAVAALAQADWERLSASALRVRAGFHASADIYTEHPMCQQAAWRLDLATTLPIYRAFSRTTGPTPIWLRSWVLGLAQRLTVIGPSHIDLSVSIDAVVLEVVPWGELDNDYTWPVG